MEERDSLKAIYRRLEKLLRIVKDGRGDPAETAAAAHQAETIMRKYQIDESEIIEKELKSQNPDMFDNFDVGCTYDQGATGVINAKQTLSRLSVAVARLNDCQALFVTDSIFGKMIRFRGYRPDVMVCKFSFRYILNQMRVASKGIRHPEDFRNGFIQSVCESLKRALAEKQNELAGQVGSRALVVIKKDAVEAFFGAVNYQSTSVKVGNQNAYEDGKAAGKKLDVLLRGVGNTSAPETVRLK